MEADRELKLCEAFCADLGVPFVAGRADVPRMARELGIGLEEAGREARYEFLRKAAFETGCQIIATGHTRSDHVETVLLNLTRGCGLAGIAGIPERRDQIVRPLLDAAREETRAYCEELGLWFHDDPANSDPRFSRSRVRLHVIPELRNINSNVENAISRLAAIAREEDGFLNGMAAAALERAEVPLNGPLKFLTEDTEVCFATAEIGALPAVLFRRAIRLSVEALGGQLDSLQTLRIQQQIAGGDPGSVTAEGGAVVAEWNSDRIHVRRLTLEEPFRQLLTVPGEIISDDFGWRFVAYPEAAGGAPPMRASMDVKVGRVNGPLFFRSAQPGDKMQPLGFSGHRKLSDLLAEAGLTSAARSRLPIVCDMLGPLWAPGVALDERARPAPDATQVLRLKFEKNLESR
jgi:tRNA(Ile)-lysidine synthase